MSEEKAAQIDPAATTVITELYSTQKNLKLEENGGLTILQKHTSREAQNILDGFPLLNFMKSSVLLIPKKSFVKDKSSNMKT